ncbi:hypothetical protein HDF18_20390 [Mucilaginibacter sp. X5P1]|uniref:hypothetical protein n=1 Tax=Mucilaginibacter sp. X5P1 TaxID=2723088 RepID=UPI00160D2243|nr:hypothetical protein [Mucilaginibacter sp. X5P1]MBB6139964.1 hypothetical protein [Mucilaginibacter sp. X5P1]
MKKLNYSKLIPIMAFVAISVTVLNYRTEKKHLITHLNSKKADIDLGNFGYPNDMGTYYEVYGNSSHQVTEVDFYNTGLPVYSFSGPKLGGWGYNETYYVNNLTVTPNYGDTAFIYSGPLRY